MSFILPNHLGLISERGQTDVMDDVYSLILSWFAPLGKKGELPTNFDHDKTTTAPKYDLARANLGPVIGLGSTSATHLAHLPSVSEPGKHKEVVCKILKAGRSSASVEFQCEIKALEAVAGTPYVVRIHGSETNRTGQMKVFLEYCSRGELYAVVDKIGAMPETVARIYAKQLWAAISGIHAKGVAHRDLKPENMLLAEDWSLRVADFGFATTGDVQLSTQFCGSEGYAAPEIMAQQPYDPSLSDVWSAGVTMFCMLAGTHPFAAVNTTCWFFCRVLDDDWTAFWEQHARFTPAVAGLSLEAKCFLELALAPYPETRPTAAQVLADPWLAGETHPNVAQFMEVAIAESRAL